MTLGFTRPDDKMPNWWIGVEDGDDDRLIGAAGAVVRALVQLYRVDPDELLAGLIDQILRVVGRMNQRITDYGPGYGAAAAVVTRARHRAYFIGRPRRSEEPWVPDYDGLIAKQILVWPDVPWEGEITEQEVLNRDLPPAYEVIELGFGRQGDGGPTIAGTFENGQVDGFNTRPRGVVTLIHFVGGVWQTPWRVKSSDRTPRSGRSATGTAPVPSEEDPAAGDPSTRSSGPRPGGLAGGVLPCLSHRVPIVRMLCPSTSRTPCTVRDVRSPVCRSRSATSPTTCGCGCRSVGWWIWFRAMELRAPLVRVSLVLVVRWRS